MCDLNFDLTNKIAFVTGGCGLIGSAVCEALKKAGAKTFALEAATENIRKSDIPIIEFDAALSNDLDERLTKIETTHGETSIWVNCAYPKTKNWSQMRPREIDPEEWAKNVDIQLNSQCLISSAIAKRMANRGGGSIITIGSIYGSVGADFQLYEGTDMLLPPAYSAIKGGIHNFTRYLASYYGLKNVRVNAICPGGIFDEQPAQFITNYNSRVPMGRLAKPNEIGGPVVFLASSAASYVTGVTLMVDGGWTAI